MTNKNETKTEKYRFENGSLFEYDKESNSYIHCFKHAMYTTKNQAIAAYEGHSYHEEMTDDCVSGWGE